MGYIGRNIKKIRNVKGLSQQAFADMFDLTRGNISSYEEFRAEPKIEMVVKVAKYFGIPLSDFIQKDLSVNELLHYNAGIVLETEKLKIAQQLLNISFVPAIYAHDYAIKYSDADFLNQLPHIIIPCSSKFRLLAMEVDNQDALPSGCDFINGDVLIYELVVKENSHRIVGKMGMLVDSQGVKYGIYQQKDNKTILVLNELVEYSFEIGSDMECWVLRGTYTQR